VKRFARCTNCQQWYVQTYTTSVEIYQHGTLCCLTVWCLRCIDEAEKRSQLHGTALDLKQRPSPLASSDVAQQLMQEHLQLMDRALYDEETLVVSAIHDFMERCRLYQTQLEIPEQCQRLAGHLQYWETFLQALNASSPHRATSAQSESSEDCDRG
jgi:G:T/U-mismatch repair DNA glycosylase